MTFKNKRLNFDLVLNGGNKTIMLDKEFKYYQKHQSELVKKYNGRFLIIKDEKGQGDFGTHLDAYTEAKKKFKVGTFLIQHCIPGKESYTQLYHTHRVVFH